MNEELKNQTTEPVEEVNENEAAPATEEPVALSPEEEAIAIEHMAIRRSASLIFINEYSEVIKVYKQDIIGAILNLLTEEDRNKIIPRIDNAVVGIASYENVNMLASDNSPIFNTDKNTYFLMRELFKNAKGYEDRNIPAEIVALQGYGNTRYLLFRESLYVYGLGADYEVIKTVDPTFVTAIYVNPVQFNNVMISLLINHIEAWIPGIAGEEFYNEELLQKFYQTFGGNILFFAKMALTRAYTDMTAGYDGPFQQMLQSYESYNYKIDLETKLNDNTMALSIYDIRDNEQSLAEMLAEDSIGEDEDTLMDAIEEDYPEPAAMSAYDAEREAEEIASALKSADEIFAEEAEEE